MKVLVKAESVITVIKEVFDMLFTGGSGVKVRR